MKYFAIRTFDNYIPANILLLRLRNEGIDCHIQDENTVTIDPLLSPAIGGMKLMVNESDIEKATTILNQLDEALLRSIKCPKCHSAAIQKIIKSSQPKNIFYALFYKLLNGSITDDIIYYRCSNCGYILLEEDSVPDF